LIFSRTENIILAMGALIKVEAALLLALLQGPGYGLQLIERVRIRSRGRVRLPQGVVYPALLRLERRKLLRRWAANSKRIGRPRRYYELTPTGILVAQSERDAIAGFATGETLQAPSTQEIVIMRERLSECGEVAEAALWLQRTGRRLGL
jgi:PadR family transcriptional regulator PadR